MARILLPCSAFYLFLLTTLLFANWGLPNVSSSTSLFLRSSSSSHIVRGSKALSGAKSLSIVENSFFAFLRALGCAFHLCVFVHVISTLHSLSLSFTLLPCPRAVFVCASDFQNKLSFVLPYSFQNPILDLNPQTFRILSCSNLNKNINILAKYLTFAVYHAHKLTIDNAIFVSHDTSLQAREDCNAMLNLQGTAFMCKTVEYVSELVQSQSYSGPAISSCCYVLEQRGG